MLLRITISNFLSFFEETTFDMFPNPKRTSFQNHVYSDQKIPLLKQAAIYGANGSGKSNFIKALIFIKSFITDENYLKNIDLDDYFFQLSKEKKVGIKFELEFKIKEKYYIYSTEIFKKSISETLKISGTGTGEDRLLFERKDNEVKSDYIDNESSAKQLLNMNPNSSLLPLNEKFPVLSTNDAKKAFKWFQNQLEIITVNSTIPILIEIMSQNPRLLSFANDIFRKIGIGIESVSIDKTPLKKWILNNKNIEDLQQIIELDSLKPNLGFAKIQDNRNIFAVSLNQGVETVKEFIFNQIGLLGYQKGMKILSQSDGTFRLLTLIPALYNAVYSEKVVFIDEVDNSIHPNLMFSLLLYYANLKTNGQLIYTTHNTKLLNQQELLRPDEVWLTEKVDGNTKMYSINEFKIHNTINIENGYLDGRYGAIPQIEHLETE